MFSIKETKSGGVAIIFSKGYRENALRIAAEMLNTVVTEQNTDGAQTLAEIKTNVEGKNIPKITSKTPAILPEKTLSKQEIYDEVKWLTGIIAPKVEDRRRFWSVVYKELTERTDLTITAIKRMRTSAKYSGTASASKYSTIIQKGYGFELLRVITDIYDGKISL